MSGINRVRKLQILYFINKKTKTKKLKKKRKGVHSHPHYRDY